MNDTPVKDPKDTNNGIDWFTEALRRQMLRAIDTWDDQVSLNTALYRERVMKAATVGDLININYYDWSLYNDISMLTTIMDEACEQRDDPYPTPKGEKDD